MAGHLELQTAVQKADHSVDQRETQWVWWRASWMVVQKARQKDGPTADYWETQMALHSDRPKVARKAAHWVAHSDSRMAVQMVGQKVVLTARLKGGRTAARWATSTGHRLDHKMAVQKAVHSVY